MKWPKIITVVAVVILLYCGVSIAGYAYLYSPVLKIDFSNMEFSNFARFLSNPQLGVELILEAKAPVPISARIDQIGRLQATVNRSV